MIGKGRLKIVVGIGFLFFLFCQQFVLAEELYIITTTDGSQIIVKEYSFTEEHVRFTTPNDLPGFIQRDQFASISNMVGIPPRDPVQTQRSIEEEKKEGMRIWLITAAVLVSLYALFVILVTRRRKQAVQEDDVDIHYNRRDREPRTQGHLSFQYKEKFSRERNWVIEVRRGYEEEGVLYIEGICVASGKLKTFRADRVVGNVTDMSSDHQGPMHRFFAAAQEEEA